MSTDADNPDPRRSLPAIPANSSRGESLRYSGGRAAAQGPGGGATAAVTPGFLWWTFRQWWLVILPVGAVLSLIAAAVIIFTYKPDYQSAALVMIEDSAPYIAFSKEGSASGTARYVETQVELLRSPLVLEPVLSEEKIAKIPEIAAATDPLGYLQENLKINRIGQSELYTIAFSGKDPQQAADVANAVVRQYLVIQSKDEDDRRGRVIELLDQERTNRSLQVERLRQKVMKLAADVTGRDPFGNNFTLDAERASSPVTTTYQEMTKLEVELALARLELKSLEGGDPQIASEDESSGLADLEVENNPAIQASQGQISELTLRLEKQKSLYTDREKNKNYQDLKSEIEQRETALKELRSKLRQDWLLERTSDLESRRAVSIGALKRKIAELESRRALLKDRFDGEMTSLKQGGSKTVEFEFARAELSREEKIFEMLASRKLAMQTERRAPTRVTSKKLAAAAQRPLAPLPYKLLFLACAASFGMPFGLAVLREMTIKRIGDSEQLSRETRAPVLGEISHFPIRRAAANPNQLSSALRRQMFLYLDSVDSLRTSIALSHNGQVLQVLVVTSGAAAEGKTCLSTSLAMSIARAEKRPVLVIDADLRSPDVATVLSVRDKPGFAELLRSEASLGDVIQRVGKTNVYVIPAGRARGNPHHLIRTDKCQPILEKLRGDFATIVIDTPPIFGGSESLVLAKMADATIVSTMCNKSRSKQVGMALERLEGAGANVLGAVLNGRSAQGYAYAYGYGSYSGRLDALNG